MSDYHLHRLTLTSFRNFPSLRLECAATPVVLAGPNGGGKTNILEAISLLAPGRGLRRAALTDMQGRDVHGQALSEPWAVVAELNGPGGFTTLATGLDPESTGPPRRLVRIDGKPARSQAGLTEQIGLAWITPELDRILAESQSARRKLLDRLVYGFDPAHAGRVTRYEEAMRERARLLRDGPHEPAWLNALEDTLAKSGTAIAAARLQMTAQLNHQMQEVTGAFPAATLHLEGTVEEQLQKNPALVAEETLRAKFAQQRGQDQQTGTTNVGPHRSDLIVIHRPKNMPIDLCSTGEQKALLVTVMLCHAQLLRHWRGVAPLLLLDDIAAHLDETRRAALYDWLLTLGSQFWLSGTESALFAPLRDQAQFYHVQHGKARAA
ncbi:MAG: DNA replication/repair protein RecF [Alphaproteobacteria bacterium]